ncbi:hypothetical protein HDU88_004260 [Geranomyces variabilis]|nr:hypothetical protein HDU88_004260 [Geranomyces variabilis]
MGAASSSPDPERGEGQKFRIRMTLPIFGYLTIQNLVLAVAVGVTSILLYNNQAISSNDDTASLGIATGFGNGGPNSIYACTTAVVLNVNFPLHALENSAQLSGTGFINVSNFENLARWFLPQTTQYPMSTTFAWAEYPSGDNFGIAVTGPNNLVVEIVNSKRGRVCPAALYDAPSGGCKVLAGKKARYSINLDGTINPTPVETPSSSKIPFNSPNLVGNAGKPWGYYALTAAPPNVASWYPFVKLSSPERQTLGLYYVLPVWSGSTFLGTFEGEMELTQTQAFLSDALKTVTPHTVIYIVQRADGTLVGSTVDPVVYIPPTNATKPAIVNVNTTTNAFVNLTQNYLQQKFGALNSIHAVTQASVSDAVAGITYLVTVTPLQDGKNLDWLIILGAPEMDYIGDSVALQQSLSDNLAANNRKVIGVVAGIIVACVVAATGYVYIAVVRPLHQLCDAMRKAQNFDFSSIAQGTFTTSPSFLREVYESQKAFYDMTTKFAMAFKANRSLAMGGQSSQGARNESSKGKLGASAQTVPLLSPT